MRHTRHSCARSTGHAPRTFKAPTGFYAPMPKPLSGEINRVLQGGYPPVPYRSRNDWGDAGRYAGEPFASNQVRMELLSSRKDEAGTPTQ